MLNRVKECKQLATKLYNSKQINMKTFILIMNDIENYIKENNIKTW